MSFDATLEAFRNGPRHQQLYYSLVKNPPTQYNALIERAHRYAEGEETKLRQTKFDTDQKQSVETSRHATLLPTKMEDTRNPTRDGRTPRDVGKSTPRRGNRPPDRRRMYVDHNRARHSYEDRYTTLNTDRAQILHHISNTDMSNKVK